MTRISSFCDKPLVRLALFVVVCLDSFVGLVHVLLFVSGLSKGLDFGLVKERPIKHVLIFYLPDSRAQECHGGFQYDFIISLSLKTNSRKTRMELSSDLVL